jgi:exodeoxyribonuclease III
VRQEHLSKNIRLATWNVNSINVRIGHLVDFLNRDQPDIVALQELKSTEENLPIAAIEASGYHVSAFGQKAYNGVAILSKVKPSQVEKGFFFVEGDAQPENPLLADARFIMATIDDLKVASVYVPNGQALNSEKYPMKLHWLRELRRYLNSNVQTTEKFALMGDFNIAPDDRDVYDPKAWQNHIHCSQPEREALKNLLSFGLVDTFRMHHEGAGHHSWWDYRMDSFQLNRGLRIDMIYTTFALARACRGSTIVQRTRGLDRPSDHAPVVADFAY